MNVVANSKQYHYWILEMIEILNKKNCSGCGACVEICPKNCISLQPDSEGFLYPLINNTKCINCGLCNKSCPFAQKESLSYSPIIVAAKSKNDYLRYCSSSGGAFSVLASFFLKNGGIVIGATMHNNCKKVQHIIVESLDELNKVLGSKYIPSDAHLTFKTVKKFLEQDRKVLFSGTPCQVAGLKCFLQKDYDNLLTVDIVCHGLPSQMLWDRYIEYLEKRFCKNIDGVYFRSKKYSWRDFPHNSLDFKKQYSEFALANPYFRIFNSGIALRLSCYDCKAKLGMSKSDITLGDFWGVQHFFPGFDDKKGVSLICLNTCKGKKYFSKISTNMDWISDDLRIEQISPYNPGLKPKTNFDPRRNYFYTDLEKMRFSDLANKYANLSFKEKVRFRLMKYRFWFILEKMRGHEFVYKYSFVVNFGKKLGKDS